ncbi:hypothetical protein WJX81_005732 [Elliptochloris bilobata]|uniref:Uncharacterized protein n=1 Tax=Elliptochloris bilobata TaxID=381761 RepID=A0AAW1RMF2_9CHLO
MAVFTPLQELCVKAVAARFESNPSVIASLPTTCTPQVLRLLGTDVPLELAVPLLSCESYWRRRARVKWSLAAVETGGSWKQLYLERNLAEALEAFDGESAGEERLLALLRCTGGHVRALALHQLPLHLDLAALFQHLPGLTSLALVYGRRAVGVDYERALFGMRLAACRALAQALPSAPGLARLDLSGNLLEDDKARLLADGLARSRVTHLSLAHNRIGDRGAKALAQLLEEPNTLEELVLDNNQILAPGGRALARALRGNPVLASLQLQLNRVGDEGACALAEALLGNSRLQRLGLGANRLGFQAAAAFSWMLRSNSSLLALDVSCNPLTAAGGEELRSALQHNMGLLGLEMRHSQVSEEAEQAILMELRRRQR